MHGNYSFVDRHFQQSGFSSAAQEKRVQTLELEASKLSQELSKIRGDSLIFGSSLAHPARTQQLAQLDHINSHSVTSKLGSDEQLKNVNLHIVGGSGVKSALNAIADTAAHSEQPPIINIYIGGSGDKNFASATTMRAEESDEAQGETGLLHSLESKLRAQDREISRILSSRRIPAVLHSGGGEDGARMQSLSELPSMRAQPGLHLGRIEGDIERTLRELSQVHQRLQVPSPFAPTEKECHASHPLYVSRLTKLVPWCV